VPVNYVIMKLRETELRTMPKRSSLTTWQTKAKLRSEWICRLSRGFSRGSCRCISANVSVGWCLSGRVIAWALSRNERENSACLWALTLALTKLCVSVLLSHRCGCGKSSLSSATATCSNKYRHKQGRYSTTSIIRKSLYVQP